MRRMMAFIVLVSLIVMGTGFAIARDDEQSLGGYTPIPDVDGNIAFDLNQKGVDHFNQKEYDQALACFKQAYEITPDDKTVVENLFAVNSHLGIECLNKKEFREAIDYFKTARELAHNPDIDKNIAYAYFSIAQEIYDKTKDLDQTIANIEEGLEYDKDNVHIKEQAAMLLYNRAMELYAQHEYENSAEMLKRSLEYNSRQAYAHEVLGDIAYYKQDLDNAKQHWLTAGEIEPSERIAKKMSKLDGEIPIDTKLKEYPSEYFIVKYAKNDEFYSGYKIRELLRKAYRIVGNDFNYYPKHKIVVLLYGPEDMDVVLSKHHWAGAVYDGKIRLPQENADVTDENLRVLIAHEYTHAIVHDLSGGKAPTWLNEGLAEWQENKVQKIDCSTLKPMLTFGSEFDYRKEFTKSIADLSYEDARLFYVLSFTLTKYMIERYRIFKVKEILAYMKEGATIDEALNKGLIIAPEKLNRNWNDYLKKNFK
jgi:tetratricopeptide (TPR) repeat protein